ncbi:hypothetical protein M569_06160, partial [Genlisea aurea]
CAILQEDCEVISESPLQINIKLRPYSTDAGPQGSDAFAMLVARFVRGYPYKSPKLEIVPEHGISEADANNLLSRLQDQASSNAREGRVMIYNLVEAAQEFLSEIIPSSESRKSVSIVSTNDCCKQLAEKGSQVIGDEDDSTCGPFVCSRLDLFSSCGELWQWNIDVEENNKKISPPMYLNPANVKLSKLLDKPINHSEVKSDSVENLHKHSQILGTLEEESEDETNSVDSVGNRMGGGVKVRSGLFMEINSSDLGCDDLSSNTESTFSESADDQPNQIVKRDLILVHLLRLACNPKGPLANSLPEVTAELFKLGIISEGARDMVTQPSTSFDKTFDRVFQNHIRSSKLSCFWGAASEFEGQSSSLPNSHYLDDFEELQPLGHGGFGHVVLCKNKLDGRQYAVKKIRLNDQSAAVNDRILREVATLSRLQHQHVVRYYQAWYERGLFGCAASTTWGSKTGMSSSVETRSSDQFAQQNMSESTYLYIQMEYCPKTLRQVLESYTNFDKDLAWHFFRQIVEGLAHIHGQGIIHRDLNPNNIFFDARNDIKIGDFGLAKFLKLDQLDQDADAIETVGASIDGTGQVGTYFYTAPETEQGWPKINEKVDMYSLGVIFFELWHPFDTAMERHVLLSDLKKGELPSKWVKEFSEQASLLRRLMSSIPSDRPSATELLKHAFPPRMEYEMLDNILRTIHNVEDTSVYEKVVSAIFDEDKCSAEDNHEHDGRLIPLQDDKSFVVLTTLDSGCRDMAVDFAREVFRQHCAVHLEIIPMKIIGPCRKGSRRSVKLLTHGGDMVELSHELRMPFANWLIKNQKSFSKRYEISYVYRTAIGHSAPNRYLQGDFDIVGGKKSLTEAEVIKVSLDIVSHFFNPESCNIHLNHGVLLEAIWSWTGIKDEKRQKVAELLSLLGSLHPQSSERKSKWVVIRRQLKQELDLADGSLNRLQTVGLRFCGALDQALPRLRGALPADKSTDKALDELSELFKYLRIWKIDMHAFLDALMPPTEIYHRSLYFQV